MNARNGALYFEIQEESPELLWSPATALFYQTFPVFHKFDMFDIVWYDYKSIRIVFVQIAALCYRNYVSTPTHKVKFTLKMITL